MNATGSSKPSLSSGLNVSGLRPLIAVAALAVPLVLGACAKVPYPPPHKTLKAQQAALQAEETAMPTASEAGPERAVPDAAATTARDGAPTAEEGPELAAEDRPAEPEPAAELAPTDTRSAEPAGHAGPRSLGRRFATPPVPEAVAEEEAEPPMPPPPLAQTARDRPERDRAAAPETTAPETTALGAADRSPAPNAPESAPVAPVATAPLDGPAAAEEPQVEENARISAATSERTHATIAMPPPPMAAEAAPVETAEADSAEPSAAGLDRIEPAADERFMGEQVAARPTSQALGARIVFESESAVLSPDAQAELAALASALAAQENSQVMILGYSANAGGDEEAARARFLSLSRSMAVRRFLMVRGLPSNRLVARALGGQVAEGPGDRVDVVVKPL